MHHPAIQILKELEETGTHDASRPGAAPTAAKSGTGDLKSLVRNLKDEAEMEAIGKTLERTKWNRKEAAKALNISYKALLYKIRQYGLERANTFIVTSLLSLLASRLW